MEGCAHGTFEASRWLEDPETQTMGHTTGNSRGVFVVGGGAVGDIEVWLAGRYLIQTFFLRFSRLDREIEVAMLNIEKLVLERSGSGRWSWSVGEEECVGEVWLQNRRTGQNRRTEFGGVCCQRRIQVTVAGKGRE